MIEFNKFYRTAGVLKKGQLSKPPILNTPNLVLPFWSALHTATYGNGVVGLTANDPLLRSLDKSVKILTLFPRTDVKELPGKVVPINVRPLEVISKYMRTVPKWHRGDQEPGGLKIKANLVVYNYGLFSLSTQYQISNMARYNQFLGFWKTVVDTIAATINQPKPKTGINGTAVRNHILLVEVPDVIPGRKILNNVFTRPDAPDRINVLLNPERMFISQLWNWMGGVQSIFDDLTDDNLKQVNIMFRRGQNSILINMHILKGMIKSKPGEATPQAGKRIDLVQGQDYNVVTLLEAHSNLLLMLTKLKAAADSAIPNPILTPEVVAGNGETVADQTNLMEQETAILNDEEPDAPEEKAILQRFQADTDESGKTMEATILDAIRSKNGKQGAVDNPSDDLEDIFNNEHDEEIHEESAKQELEDTLNALDEVNDELLSDVADNTAEDDEQEESFVQEVEEGTLEQTVQEVFKNVSYKSYETESQDPEESFLRLVREQVESGAISVAEERRFAAIAKKWRTTIKNPYGEGTLADGAKINPEDLIIPENHKLAKKIPGVLNETYLESSHDLMHKHYIKNILNRDILSNSIQLMKAGYAIDNYEVRTHNDVVDNYEIHTIRLVPIRGKPSTISFRVPVVNPNGTFKAGGNINRMRSQRADIPIRKVSPGEVALTSYHSKMWVRRSPLVAFNFDKYLEKVITAAATNPEKQLITNVSYGNCFDSTIEAPLAYTSISRHFSSFRIGALDFMFDVKRMDNFFGADVNEVAKKYRGQQMLVGKGPDSLLWMANDGVITEASILDAKVTKTLGTITDMIGVDPFKIPVQSADLQIFSKSIPIGIALAFWIGLGNLLTTIKANYRRVPAKSPLNLQPHEFYVKFQDETLIFNRNDAVTSLVMSGWNEYHAFIKFYSVYEFDKKDTYGRFFYQTKIEGRYENELNIIRQLWIDPITEGELIRLKEPTDMVNLFLSGVNKLTYDRHPNPMDGLFQRDRGYERISGFVYDNMVRSVRGHRNRKYMRDAAIDMKPEAIWYDILKDQTTGIAEFSNPIHSLKEQEVVVFRGAGGRSSQSMMAGSRKAHRSNVGRDSEATVDSGDVATVLYTTANPNYDSVRGTVRYTDKPNENASRAFGTSQLLAPGAEFDD